MFTVYSEAYRSLVIAKFRIKLKSLAEEAKIIRREERRFKTHIVEQYLTDFRPNRDPRPKTVKTASAIQLFLIPGMRLSETAAGKYKIKKKIIKTFEHNDFVREILRCHRTKELRTEALYTLLAYAFYRGKPVTSVMPKKTKSIDRKRIMDMVVRMQANPMLRKEVDRFNQWAVEGKLEHQPGRIAHI